MPWPEFLKQLQGRYASLLAFAYDWWLYNTPLVERIRQLVPPPARILEVGTATGAIAVLLAAHGYEVVGIDRDPDVIEGARAFAERFRVGCRFEVADGFELTRYAGQFDLAFSAGVIEHFPPERAVQMLKEKARVARSVLAVVPTWRALRNDPLTDASGARPMRLRELKGLFRAAGLGVLKGFGYGIPDGRFSPAYRWLLPGALQWLLQNRYSYACSIGCFGRPMSPADEAVNRRPMIGVDGAP